MSKQGSTPPPSPTGKGTKVPGRSEGGWPRWSAWIVVGILITLLAAASALGTDSSEEISYTEFLAAVEQDSVASIEYDNTTARIVGTRNDETTFRTTGLSPFPDADLKLVNDHDVEIKPETPTGNFFLNLLPLFLPFMIIIGFFWWMARRQQSQMGGIMSIGRSKAKTYSSERPGTSFDDVAGYASVKKEITEVVDFLKEPAKFAEIGA